MLTRVSKPLRIFAFLCLAAAGLTGILVLYSQLSRISDLDVLDSIRLAVDQTAINLNDRMDFAEENLRSVLYDTRIHDSLTRLPEQETLENQLEEIKDLRDVISITAKNRDIEQIRVYLPDIKMLTREGVNFFSLSEAQQIPEYEPLLIANSYTAWIGSHPVKTTYFDKSCISLGCIYRRDNIQSGRNWALVLLDLSLEHFSQVLDALILPDEGAHAAVTSPDGAVMFGSGDAEILSAVLRHQASPGESSGFLQASDGAEFAYIYKPLDHAGWSIIAYMPRNSLLNNRSVLRKMLTLLLFVLTLMMIALLGIAQLALYERRVYRYIRELNESLKHSSGKDTRLMPSHRALSRLDSNIAELLSTNEQLAQEKYKAELREQKVKLQALQAQINPHFLYNTLDSISWMAIRENAPDVSEALATLADYFRLSLSRGRSVVTLREDSTIVQKYLRLYERRFDFHYQVLWETDEEALDCMIPKLTLQPLIENALHHGIFKRPEKSGGIIRITAAVTDGMLLLSIWDNGPGLPVQTPAKKGYGLNNVRERLDLYFKSSYTMEIKNAPDGGVQVTLKVAAEKTPRD